MFDKNGTFTPTDKQQKRMAYMAARDWQHIANDREGNVVMTMPVGMRYLDAVIQPSGTASYSSPRI